MAIAGLTSCNHDLSDHFGVSDNPSTGVTEITIDLTALDAKYLNDEKTQLKLKAGDEVTLSFNIKPDGFTDADVTLTSGDNEIVSIDGKKVKALKIGTTTVTAKAGDKSATCEVTVIPGLATPLTMEVLTPGTIRITSPRENMKYKKNEEAIVVMDGTVDVTIEDLKAGDKVAFYGNGTSITSYYDVSSNTGTRISSGTAEVKVYGNIMSLVDEENFATAISIPETATFEELFFGNEKLIDASNLLLPATTLTNSCYEYMFVGCSKLIKATKLPAMDLAEHCYHGMFAWCPSLTTAPELLATTLVESCYESIFLECSNLSVVTCLATNISASNCTKNWLKKAGTDASVTSRELHIKNGQSTTDANWNLATSGNGTDKLWTAVDDK